MTSKLPLEAVQSECLSGEGGSAGEADDCGERGRHMCVCMRLEVKDVCEWGAFMRGENMAGGFWGRGFVSRVFTLDERFQGYPHICHRAKFERNWTTRGRVIAIWLIGLGRHPPSLIFEESIFESLHTLRDPIVFAHTNFGENSLISSDDMPPKRNSNKTLLSGGIQLPALRFTTAVFRVRSCVSSCKILAKSDNRRLRYSGLTYWTRPPSAILDFRRKRLWTILHVAGPYYLRTHHIWWR